MLFSPGPVMTRQNVRESLMHYDICHRSKEFEAMYAGLCKKINRIFNADDTYRSVVISGSGTSANETVISSVLNDGDKVLLLRNGEFGDRLKQLYDQYKIEYVDCAFEWGTMMDVDDVEAALRANPEVKMISMVFHETSSSMINPVPAVGALADKYGKWFHVDCVSAAAGQHIDVTDNHITFATSVGGKCVGAYPGSAYVCAKIDVLETLTPEMGRNVYLNLARHYQKAKSNEQTPNTPNVTLFWALDTALDNILSEGLDAQIARYQECAKILRDGMRELGLKMLLPDEQMANTVTSVFLPAGMDLEAFLSDMEAHGYTVYAGKGVFYDQNMFQVANMGEIYPEDCHKFLGVLKECIA
jgi:2-aminoethylphosphonate-pyruvate transaminase